MPMQNLHSQYAGLATYIFTTNVQHSWHVTEALECGIVGVNDGLVSTGFLFTSRGRQCMCVVFNNYLLFFHVDGSIVGMKQLGLRREGSKIWD